MARATAMNRIDDMRRTPGKRFGTGVIPLLAVAYALFHLWLAGLGLMPVGAARHYHLMMALSLVFLVHPLGGGANPWLRAVDFVLIALSLLVGAYLEWEAMDLMWRAGEPNTTDMILGVINVFLVLEMARRTIGWVLSITAIVFIAYSFLGDYIPGYFGHRGYGLDVVINAFYLELRGIYGKSLGVVVEFVVLFVLFGAFLKATGGAQFFIDLSNILTGSSRGGPAKMAVCASAMMGSLSGSATANVVTTGSITIPLMKKSGFPSYAAGGIETAASAGGVMLPPVMGAAAFLIVALTGTPYREVMMAATVPAAMYFFSVYVSVHIYAVKYNIVGMPPPDHYWQTLGRVLLRGIPYLFSIGLLVYLLLAGRTATYAAFYAIVALIGTTLFQRETRLTPTKAWTALRDGAQDSLAVSAACACAGLIVGVVEMTGIGIKFSSLVVSGSGGNLFLGILFVGLASLILGMELPITASYLIVAVLGAPALEAMGIPLLTAHLIVFWFAIDAAVTPPVAITSYVAAGLADAPPMRTAFYAWKTAKGLYVIPFLMAYTPITGTGPASDIAFYAVTGAISLVAVSAVFEGHLLRPLALWQRVMMAGIAAAGLYPGIFSSLVAAAVFLGILATQLWTERRTGSVDHVSPMDCSDATPPSSKAVTPNATE